MLFILRDHYLPADQSDLGNESGSSHLPIMSTRQLLLFALISTAFALSTPAPAPVECSGRKLLTCCWGNTGAPCSMYLGDKKYVETCKDFVSSIPNRQPGKRLRLFL
jgi:hypothetical protein